MKKIIKKIITTLLKPAGLKLCRIDAYNKARLEQNLKYAGLVEEFSGFLNEAIFKELPHREGRIELMAKLLGVGVSEAMYIISYLHKALGVEGDICEFGVAQGATSALLANEIRPTHKNLWLFDSFKGLPKPHEKDVLINDIFNLGTIEDYEGTMSCPVELVRVRLNEIAFPASRTKIIPGFIEEVVNNSGSLPGKVCFAYVDFDFYSPTLATLRLLNKRLSADGFIIVDDYGWFSEGAKTAVDEFMSEHDGRYELILPHKFAGCFCILKKRQ
ncbi:MAG: macrocin O-methyltransferase [Candidatus Omnitrophica bacterium]|nr:macrocin O-methyltransferase [Candidatus Omnitrophota bacterium]